MMNARIHYYMYYRFFSSFLFFMPVLLSVYFARNITTENIFLIECLYYLTIFSFEIPTGWFADKYGHDRSVFIGLIGTFLAYSLFSISFNLLFIILSQIFLGFFSTFISGSDRASFFKYIAQISQDKEYNFLLQKRAHILSIGANLSSFIIGGVLFKYDPNGIIILFLTGLFNLLAGIFYFLFSKGIHIYNQEKKPAKKLPIPSFSLKLKSVLLPCTVSGIIIGLLANFYWVTQMYYEQLQISEEWRGALFAVVSLVTIFLSKLRVLNNKKLIKTLIFLFPACYFIVIIHNIYIIPVYILVYAILRIETQPFVENYILSLSNENKAFSLSISSWIQNAVNVLLMLIFYVLFRYLSYSYVMIIQGIVVLLFILGIYLINKSSTHKFLSITKNEA